MSEVENAYLEMPADVFNKHLEQIKEAASTKSVDLTAKFGAPALTEEIKAKLSAYDTLKAKNEELVAAASTRELSENEKRITAHTVSTLVDGIKQVDPAVPLQGFLDSGLNSLDKMDVMSNVAGIVKHYNSQISTLQAKLDAAGGGGEGDGSGGDGGDGDGNGGGGSGGGKTGKAQFSAPKGNQSAMDIIKSLLPAESESK